MIVLSKRFERLYEGISEAELARLADHLVETARPGSLLLLSGELGSGKTTLVKQIARSLGIDPHEVRSPTFTLVHEYRQGTLPLVHMDVYRLGGAEEFEGIGGYEYLDTNRGIVVIEWGELIADAFDADWLQLLLSPHGNDPGSRRDVDVTSTGPAGRAWMRRLLERVRSETP